MKDDFDGETALVTGAASGIGRATAEKLAADGADVVLADIQEDALQDVADRIAADHGVEAVAVPTDVSDEDQVADLVETAVDRFGSLDIVVSNAGLGRGGEVAEMSTAEYRQMIDVNVDGMFFVARAAVPHLKASEGNLIFLGSFAGRYPRPSNPVYAATKWWTRGFASSLATQVGDEGVAVTTVNPSEVRTGFGGGGDFDTGGAFRDRFDEGEVSEPEDVAEAVCYAAKQESPNTVQEIDLFRRDILGQTQRMDR